MTNIFEKLANGEISLDNSPYNNDVEYKQALAASSTYREKLLTTLNDEEKAIFEKFSDAQLEIESHSTTHSFTYGYKLGVVLTAEAFTRL